LERKPFVLNLPFREPQQSDALKDFQSEFLSSHNIDFPNLVSKNHDDQYVWVYDFDDKILAVLSFTDTSSDFYMDVVATNELFKQLCNETHPGFSLFSLLEDLSPSFNYSQIRLDSTSDRVEYWKRNGYELTGMPSANPIWGKLYPMTKKLA